MCGLGVLVGFCSCQPLRCSSELYGHGNCSYLVGNLVVFELPFCRRKCLRDFKLIEYKGYEGVFINAPGKFRDFGCDGGTYGWILTPLAGPPGGGIDSSRYDKFSVVFGSR